ncbi:MAG: ATP-binding cassette domain-containing protein [Paraperlucidibaca sp.]|jgi:ATP-binding cassette subfamily F protein uup|uniref:ATP-binding cassette domain-containing protein n=1 Tax=Paraperlucidibaca sp. TaxID=2708021 RepID=UPI001B439A27|nr:ATP-binding cassette domain-containing protein [Paraperlucidibaca sp.]MBQ0722399.1 ATP-binding cassette domain-containing protein [Paraperlucidibaca sp.]MBQ0841974.1 ATP-binding cassette domain-containing protein [Paraperlucidibaca sp.]|tara:strand:- start:2044 stop:3840 length:1797 start_codon:yes stop_codon:yes gene_type:complete
MALLSLRDVSIAFGGPALLSKVSFSLERGERVCVIGRNGEGKSTLLKIIAGELIADTGEVMRTQGARVASLRQEVPQGWTGTVEDIIAGGFDDLPDSDAALEDWEIQIRINKITTRLSLDPYADFNSLSGGRKRRVLLARALVTEPDILLLDEPTNHLDVRSITWIEDFLLGWNGTLLFISHDRRFLGNLATRLVEVDRGQLRSYPGNYEAYLERKAEQLSAEGHQNAVFDKKLAQEEVWIRQGIKARRTRNEGRVRDLEQLRRERAERRNRQGNARLVMAEAERSGKLVLTAENLSLSLGGLNLVQDFSTVIMRGDKIGLIGDNGVGKTTLIRMLLDDLEPDAGKITHGTQLSVNYFDQLRSALDLEATVVDNVGQGSDYIEINGQRKHILGYLQDFLFSPQRARTPVKALSGGERNRLLLAKLFTRPSNVLILDEPTNDLDVETLELLEELLVSYPGTLLLISHDRAFLDAVVTSTWVFEGEGQINEYVGGYADWLRQRPEPISTVSEVPTAKAAATSAKPAKRKLSFKEQRELDAIPGKIDALEAEQAELQAALADGQLFVSDLEKATAMAQRLPLIDDELLVLLSRWEEFGGEA